MAGPIVQRHFEKVEADREAVQARVNAEKAAKKAGEDEARKQAESEKAAKDAEMADADAAPKADEAEDPK